MEGSLYNTYRSIQAYSYILWTYQLPCHSPDYDEQPLLRYGQPENYCNLYQ